MLVASLLEEGGLTPRKRVSAINTDDLGLLRGEIDQMISDIEISKKAEIEELNAQYTLFSQLISEAIAKNEDLNTQSS